MNGVSETVQWTVSAVNGRSPGGAADQIRDQTDYDLHVRYCWGNPVKHGYVERPVDWPFSSIHRDMHAGRVPDEWGAVELERAFGE